MTFLKADFIEPSPLQRHTGTKKPLRRLFLRQWRSLTDGVREGALNFRTAFGGAERGWLERLLSIRSFGLSWPLL